MKVAKKIAIANRKKIFIAQMEHAYVKAEIIFPGKYFTNQLNSHKF